MPDARDIGSWNADQPERGFDGIMVSSVDDLAARFDVADVLAHKVISVGVSGLAFHVQREDLGDGWACPYCEYVPAEPPPDAGARYRRPGRAAAGESSPQPARSTTPVSQARSQLPGRRCRG